MQIKKTAKLFIFCCVAPVLISKKYKQINTFKNLGSDIGLLFQIVDDLIDCKGDSRIVGKPTARDQKKGKATLVNLIGYDKTLIFAKKLKKKIDHQVKKYGNKSNDLQESIEFIIRRKF